MPGMRSSVAGDVAGEDRHRGTGDHGAHRRDRVHEEGERHQQRRRHGGGQARDGADHQPEERRREQRRQYLPGRDQFDGGERIGRSSALPGGRGITPKGSGTSRTLRKTKSQTSAVPMATERRLPPRNLQQPQEHHEDQRTRRDEPQRAREEDIADHAQDSDQHRQHRARLARPLRAGDQRHPCRAEPADQQHQPAGGEADRDRHRKCRSAVALPGDIREGLRIEPRPPARGRRAGRRAWCR